MLLNDTTAKLLKAFVSHPSGTLLVLGSAYSGIDEVVSNVANQLLGESAKNNIVIAEPDNGKTLGVDRIRELKRSLTTTAGSKKSQSIGRVAIVRAADRMTREAQNSILKLIEEPVSKTVLILQAQDAGALLDTVRSRCQIVKLLPLTKQQAEAYGQKAGADQTLINKSYLLSKGEPKLFEALIAKQSSDVLADIAAAKEFLTKSVFNRLAMQKTYAQSDALRSLLEALRRISEAAMHGADRANVTRWQNILTQITDCQRLANAQTPAKLVFLKLCVSI